MQHNKILPQSFNQIFHIIDKKLDIVGTPLNNKNIPDVNILNSKYHIKDKYPKLSNTSLTFFQMLNKQPPDFSKFYPYLTNNENI